MSTPSSMIESTVNEVPESRRKKNPLSGRGSGSESLTQGYSYQIDSLLTPKIAPDYVALAREHTEMLEDGKTSEQIAIWTGDKLDIAAWKEGKFYGKRGALPTPETAEEMARFQKFIEALGVTYAHDKGIEYAHANGPAKGEPQYFLLDGFIQNAWLGELNMHEIDKKLLEIHNYWNSPGINNDARAHYLHEQIGSPNKKLASIHIGYRPPLKSSGHDTGVSIGGSFYKNEEGVVTKMVKILGIIGAKSEIFENTAATGRICLLR